MAGTYLVHSPFFAVPNLYITVNEVTDEVDQTSSALGSFLSYKYSYAELETSSEGLELEAGSTIALRIVPMSATNEPIALNSQCTLTNSFYTISNTVVEFRNTFSEDLTATII